uniref:Translocon-associated protein subunit delta n=1 Tax=Gasterosteus aculeatus aculeatus TaxID=481459 RepID=G3P1H8_GASAC
MIRIAAFLALLVAACSGETCTDPAITPSAYTTSDAVISSESVFIVELSLACANGAQSVTLYADVNGRQFPVTRGQDVGKYQVSWSLPHKQASSGTYQVKFFDEESYSALRKAQRNNEDVNSIEPLFSVNIDHRVVSCDLVRYRRFKLGTSISVVGLNQCLDTLFRSCSTAFLNC